MNAHVLRKRSLAKNRIFQLLPVLTLLVLWCQCFISAASIESSSSIPINMLSFHSMGHMQAATTHSHRPTDSDRRKFYGTIAETVAADDSNVSERRDGGRRRGRRRKIHTPMHPVDRGEMGEIDNKPNTKRVMSNRIDDRDSDASSKTSDFIRRAFLHKRHKHRLTVQLQMQRTKRSRINASHRRRNLLHQRLSVLPKTIDNSSSARNNSHNPHGSNILNRSRTDPNSNRNHKNHNNNNNNNDNYHHITAKDNNYITINANNDTNYKHNNENIAIEWRRTNDNHSNDYGGDRDDDDDMYKHDAYQRMSSMPLLYRPHHRFRHHHHRWYARIERNRRSESSSSILKLNSSLPPSPPSTNTLSRSSRFSASNRMRGHPFGRSGGSHHPIRSRRFCTARDSTTLAFTAPTVFEGKVRSMSSDRRRNFSVTFEVKEIFKQKSNLTLPPLVRLRFTYKNSSECDIYRERFRPVGHVGRDQLEPGKLYILFVNQVDLGNFTILGQPAKITRKTIMDVRTGAAEKYGQRAYIESLVANNATIKEGKRLRIVCKVQGHPPPKVKWYFVDSKLANARPLSNWRKDNRAIGKNRSRYQFIHLRRRSELIIKSALANDSGQYECRAKNKLTRQPIRKFTRIDVLPKAREYTRHSNQQINWTHSGSTCPVIGNAFCLNGGTCVFFKDVGEPACKCPDGFLGNRCETKNPTNIHSSTYRNNQENRQQPHQCGENNFYGSYYC